MDWRTEAVKAVQAFDEALGRPPFPQTPSDEQVCKATALQQTFDALVRAGKLHTLDGVTEVTTTLPVLCASLKEGSPDRLPSLVLYRPLLLAAGLASPLSTYPISYLLKDAESLLGTSLSTPSSADAFTVTGARGKGAPASTRAVVDESEDALDELTLFHFMASTKTLTPDDVRRFLRLPPAPSTTAATGKGKQKKTPAPTPTTGKRGAGEAERTPAAPRELLYAMLDASLPDDCRIVFESFIDNTQKFLDVVGGDGDLAGRILDVYGARIVPRLKPSSLLLCLDAALLDYYVDIVASSQKEGRSTLLTSKEFRVVPLKTWDAARMQRLAATAASRSIRHEDTEASLLVYVFLYLLYTQLPAANAAAESESELAETERLLLLAVCKAVRAVLAVDKKNKAGSSTSAAFVQAKTGILMIAAASIPAWVESVSVFVRVFTSRTAAVAVCTAGLPLRSCESERTADEGSADLQMVEETTQLLDDQLRNQILQHTKAAPKAEQQSPASSSKPSQQRIAASKGKGKSKSGSKETVSTPQQPSSIAVDPPVPPVPLAEALSSYCECLLWTALLHRKLSMDASAAESHHPLGLVQGVLRAYAYVLQHQPQHLNAVLWQPFFGLFALSLWNSNASATPLQPKLPSLPATASHTPASTLATVMAAATTDADSMLWLSPLVLPLQRAEPQEEEDGITVLWTSPQSTLWMSVLRAAVNAQGSGARATQPLQRHLFPAPPGFVLGALCCRLSDVALHDWAEAIVTSAPMSSGSNSSLSGGSSVLVASLARVRSESWEGWSGAGDSAFGFPQSCMPFSQTQDGLRRLLEEVGALRAEHLAVIEAAEAQARERDHRAMQQQIQQTNELAAAHRAFHDAEVGKRAAKAAEQQKVQEEVARRRATQAERFREDAAARERKRQLAIQTMQQKAEQTKAQREAVRQARFVAYQHRLDSEYRVATFLEHLDLSSARVMEARDALRKVLDTITPDDLLEFLVGGVAKVPADMLEADEAADTEAEERTRVAAVAPPRPPVSASTASAQAAGTSTGERRDFWAEVMDHPEAIPKDTRFPTKGDAAQAPTAEPQPAPADPVPSVRQCSFHKRMAPLLDLFCYEEGDEYGNVPAVLPTVRLRVASRVWPPSRVQALGYADVREAFERMQQRGLLSIRNGVAQLTLLGFRYHFPFHNPEGMLEVYLREARERLRTLVASRVEVDGGGEEDDGDVEEDEEEEEEEEEEGEDEYYDPNQLLPEVEFGI